LTKSLASRRCPIVSAWATEHRLVLAQSKVQEQSNEITAIPALLELLEIIGCIVTLDAMGTQKTIAAQIQQAQADYILSLKANHPTLFQEVEGWFKTAREKGTLPMPSAHTTEAGQDRTEIRSCWTLSLDQLPPLYQVDEWVGLQTIVVVERTRHLWNQTTHEIQFYRFQFGCRQSQNCCGHSRLSGVLKIPCIGPSMSHDREDDCRVRSLHAPHNLALLRRFAVNTLNP